MGKNLLLFTYKGSIGAGGVRSGGMEGFPPAELAGSEEKGGE
jgi:hypothetical protein